MKDKLVTLFGGGGFVGRYVAQVLLREGARIRVAQRDPREAWFLRPLGGLGQAQFIAADITRPETLARAVDGADAVVNLVGILSGRLHAVHVEGAENVARTARAAGAALVHLSANGADPESPSAYGRSKGLGEQAVRAAHPEATILRPSIIFGREDNFVNRLARMVMLPVVPVLRPGFRFQPVYVADVAGVAARALNAPGTHGGRTYTLGGPDIFTMGELVRWIARETGRHPAIVELPDAAGAAIASLGFLPCSPMTRDQWLMLQRDNVVGATEEGIEAFGIAPTPLSAVAPSWLVQYRKHGRFSRRPETA